MFGKDQPESVADLKAIEAHVRKELEKIIPAVVGVKIGKARAAASSSARTATSSPPATSPASPAAMPDRSARRRRGQGQDPRQQRRHRQRHDQDRRRPANGPSSRWANPRTSRKANGCWRSAIPAASAPTARPVVRAGPDLSTDKFVIRTDCTLVGGDSGGPLFDMNGRVIGIHSRIGGSHHREHPRTISTLQKNLGQASPRANVWGGPLGPADPGAVRRRQDRLRKGSKITAGRPPTGTRSRMIRCKVHRLKVFAGQRLHHRHDQPQRQEARPVPAPRRIRTGKELAQDDDGAGGHQLPHRFPAHQGRRSTASSPRPLRRPDRPVSSSSIRQAEIKLVRRQGRGAAGGHAAQAVAAVGHG